MLFGWTVSLALIPHLLISIYRLTHKYMVVWHTNMWWTDTQIIFWQTYTQICGRLTHKYMGKWQMNMCQTNTQICGRLTHRYVVDWHTNMCLTDTQICVDWYTNMWQTDIWYVVDWHINIWWNDKRICDWPLACMFVINFKCNRIEGKAMENMMQLNLNFKSNVMFLLKKHLS